MRRRELSDDERDVLLRLRLLAVHEGMQSPAVQQERYRIAEWIEQTISEGWLPEGAQQ